MKHHANVLTEDRKPWRRLLSWMMITLMANPVMSVPLYLYVPSAQARDTDIYMAAAYAGTLAEPAILLVLDTSDSMNIPEPWREYDADTYDSHVEYLWNDPAATQTGSWWSNTTTPGMMDLISTNAPTVMSQYGSWKGNSPADRANLKAAAKAYANGTEPGDPGERKYWRNYGGALGHGNSSANWIYWLPDGTPETDPRLRSITGNKWAGGQARIGGIRGGIDYGTDSNVLSNNQCLSSYQKLFPSTVYAPNNYPKNDGKWAGQEWMRWERWLNLDTVNLANYNYYIANPMAGNAAPTNPYGTHQYDGNNTTGVHYGLYNPTGAPPNSPMSRDDYNCDTQCGWGGWGQPIRTRKPIVGAPAGTPLNVNNSHSGWTDLKADTGGYIGIYVHNYYGNVPNVYTALRAAYGYSAIGALWDWWKGNRDDAGVPFGMMTGTAAYYDGNTNETCNAATGPYNNSYCWKTRTGGSTGTTYTSTMYRDCVVTTPASTETDARLVTRYRGGTCAMEDSHCVDANDVGTPPDCPALTSVPDCGWATTLTTFYRRDNYGCAWQNPRVSVNVGTCKWNADRKLGYFGETLGWRSYDGRCVENGSDDHCNSGGADWTGGGPFNLPGVPNGQERHVIGGTSAADAAAAQAAVAGASAGCSNTLAAGTYWGNGGECRGNRRHTNSAGDPIVTDLDDDSYCDDTTTWNHKTIRGTEYDNVMLDVGGGAAGGCVDEADTDQTCNTRYGQNCHDNVCVDRSNYNTYTEGAVDPTDRYYRVYRRAAADNFLVHDCRADDPDQGNLNSPSAYMTSHRRNFNLAHNLVAAVGDSNLNAAYTTTPGDKVSAAGTVTMYSTNYLNWKFGAKACRDGTGALITAAAGLGGAASCSPIGRKTRLQIAKDALVDLVRNTNGVRFGLMVFNKKSNEDPATSEGGNIAFAVRRMNNDDGTPNTANRDALVNKINSITASAQTPLTETVYEAYRYFKGLAPQYGALATTAAGGGAVNAGNDNGNATSGGLYSSPMMSNPSTIAPAACQKNYVLLITDGGPEQDASANDAVRALTLGDVATLQPTPSGQFEDGAGVPYGTVDLQDDTNYIWLDELTYLMANGDMSPYSGTDDALRGKQNVKTYTVGFAGGNTPVLQQAATGGGGLNYVADDSDSLAAALSAVIENILSWNPVVVSAVPVGGLNLSESADDIYMGFFAPTTTLNWNGTLKKYKLSTDADRCGVDSDGQQVRLCLTGQTVLDTGYYNILKYESVTDVEVDAAGNEVSTLRKSAEIHAQAASFWSNPPVADGSKPDMGGSGLMLKTLTDSPDERNVYTYLSGHGLTPLRGDNANISPADVGAADDAGKHALINYARGGDATICNTTAPCMNWRAWPHGDVLHSSPAVLTYRVDADPDDTTDTNGDGNPSNDFTYTQTVFYMTNDGLLHAVDAATGRERWAFMPEEVLPQLNAIKTGGQGEHINAADANPVLYYRYTYENGLARLEEAKLFFGLRRGGRAYYALDVTDAAAPEFLWKIRNDQICGTTACAPATDFAELGETWSTPFVGRLRDFPTTPVLVFGAGYDPKPNDLLDAYITRSGATATVTTDVDHGYDAYNSTASNRVVVSGAAQAEYNGTFDITVTGPRSFTYSVVGAPSSPALPATNDSIRVVSAEDATMGRGVFIVNAGTGALIRSYTPAATSGGGNPANVETDIRYSMPSDAVPLNTDFDIYGYVDRLYMGDLGGNLWRFNLDDETGDGSVLWDDPTKFADLNGSVAPGTPLRKIMFPPAVVKGLDYDEVFVGTGDRENPLRLDIEDKFFMLKDTSPGLHVSPSFSTITYGVATLYDITDNQLSIDQDVLDAAAGWRLDLATQGIHTEPGEKVVNAPTVFDNVLRFGTYSPRLRPSLCLPQGKGTIYQFYASTGLVMDINNDGTVNNQDTRYDQAYVTRGMPASAGILVRDNKAWALSQSDGANRVDETGVTGARGIYWYQEPEE